MPLNNLTEEEKNILLQLSYLDLPPTINVSKMGMEINDLLELIQDKKIKVDKIRLENIKTFMEENKDTSLKDIELIGYQNNNPNKYNNSDGESESGFVGYALKDQNGDQAILFRGSENPFDWGNLKTDWLGNLQAGIGIVTKQHEEANNFYKENTKKNNGEKTIGKITIYGHSKGGNLSTYVFLKNLKDNVKAYVVNGAPIAFLGLGDKEEKALKSDRFTFISYVGDIVSHLGYVPYLDKIVIPNYFGKEVDPFYPHYETSVIFDEDGTFAKWRNPGDSQLADAEKDLNYLKINTAIFVSNKVLEVGVALGAATLEIVYLSAKGLNSAVQAVIDECVKFVASVNHVTQKFLTDVAEFLVSAARQTRLFFAKVVESTKRSITYAEEIIKVDLSRLYYYIERLQAVKRKTARVNDMIDDLYWQAGIMGLDNILKADLSTMFNFKLTDSINYLSSTAETLELVEFMLSNKASRF